MQYEPSPREPNGGTPMPTKHETSRPRVGIVMGSDSDLPVMSKAATLLDQAGICCEITPPSVVRGVGIEITVPAPTLLIPVTTDFGNLNIDVSLRPCQ